MLLPVPTALALVVALVPAPARTSAPPGTPERAVWVAPVAGPVEVVRPFRAPPGPYAAGHRGADLAADPDQEIRSAGAGRVSFAGPVAGRGVVAVTHPGGLRTTYEPVAASVRAGDTVERGAPLGRLGTSEHCPRACLHWGLRRGSEYRDPMTLLHGPRDAVRLLPLDDPVGPVSAGRPVWCAGRASPWNGSATRGSRRPRRARRPRPG